MLILLDPRPPALAWPPPRVEPPRQPPLPVEPEPEPVVRCVALDPRERRAVLALVAGIVEALGGRRPVAQLARWADAEALATMAERAGQRRRYRLRSVHLCPIGEDSVEIAAHISDDERSEAAAIRLDRIRDRWCCVAVELAPRAARASPA